MSVTQVKDNASKMIEAIRREIKNTEDVNLRIEYLNDLADFIDEEIVKAWEADDIILDGEEY